MEKVRLQVQPDASRSGTQLDFVVSTQRVFPFYMT